MAEIEEERDGGASVVEAPKIGVAVGKDESGLHALKWVLEKQIPPEGLVYLLHVQTPLRWIPTPMGNKLPVDCVSEEIVKKFREERFMETEKLLNPYRKMCLRRKVKAEVCYSESDFVQKELVDQILKLGIAKLVLGTSTHNFFSRTLKGEGISTFVAKHAPEFCTVMVVCKGKLYSVKDATQSLTLQCSSCSSISGASDASMPSDELMTRNGIQGGERSMDHPSPNWSVINDDVMSTEHTRLSKSTSVDFSCSPSEWLFSNGSSNAGFQSPQLLRMYSMQSESQFSESAPATPFYQPWSMLDHSSAHLNNGFESRASISSQARTVEQRFPDSHGQVHEHGTPRMPPADLGEPATSMDECGSTYRTLDALGVISYPDSNGLSQISVNRGDSNNPSRNEGSPVQRSLHVYESVLPDSSMAAAYPEGLVAPEVDLLQSQLNQAKLSADWAQREAEKHSEGCKQAEEVVINAMKMVHEHGTPRMPPADLGEPATSMDECGSTYRTLDALGVISYPDSNGLSQISVNRGDSNNPSRNEGSPVQRSLHVYESVLPDSSMAAAYPEGLVAPEVDLLQSQLSQAKLSADWAQREAEKHSSEGCKQAEEVVINAMKMVHEHGTPRMPPADLGEPATSMDECGSTYRTLDALGVISYHDSNGLSQISVNRGDSNNPSRNEGSPVQRSLHVYESVLPDSSMAAAYPEGLVAPEVDLLQSQLNQAKLSADWAQREAEKHSSEGCKQAEEVVINAMKMLAEHEKRRDAALKEAQIAKQQALNDARRCEEALTALKVARRDQEILQQNTAEEARKHQETQIALEALRRRVDAYVREADLAKQQAAEERRRCDEAFTKLDEVTKELEVESQLRKEAEERASQEAAAKQEALTALRKAQKKYSEYSFNELQSATDNFREEHKLGEGGYGPVYKGKLHHTTVAIKVLARDGLRGRKEFQSEVELLSHIHHPHMVMLLGACPEKACIVYEYMSNGSLEDRLHCKDETPPLPWYVRFRICSEVATALLFLHSRPQPIVHRDLKPGNILLDHNFVSKIGDVGIAKLVPNNVTFTMTMYRETVLAGTFAYIDPDYQRTGVVSRESDVYALGIVMLQLLTGRPAVGVANLVEAAVDNGRLEEVLDKSAGEWPLTEAMELACLSLQCAEPKRKHRPDLETKVLGVLERIRALADVAAANMACVGSSSRGTEPIIPSFFFCPISQEIMENPYIAADGFTYEHDVIRVWLQGHDTSPMTNLRLNHKNLIPNHSLRSAIKEWYDKGLIPT